MDRDFRGSFSGHERDRVFLNTRGTGPMVDSAFALGLDDHSDGRSILPLDVDGDGDLDLVRLGLQGLELYENQVPCGNFARIRLDAPAAEAHLAEVELHFGTTTSRGRWRFLDGFATQVSGDLHFGLGRESRIDQISVHWPSGSTDTWRNLQANRLILLSEGAKSARYGDLARWPESSRPRIDTNLDLSLKLNDLNGNSTALPATGRPMLVNVWAPWCASCETELPALAMLSEQIGDAASFVGVSIERDDLESVRASIAKHNLKYPQLIADDAWLESFFAGSDGIPLPTTFVFDARGQLARVLQREVHADELKLLLDQLADEPLSPYDLGRLATIEQRRGDNERAMQMLRAALALDPGSAELHYRLGSMLSAQGQIGLAEASFARSNEADPSFAPALRQLGLSRLRSGRAGKALAPLQALLELRGNDLESLLLVAEAAEGAGQIQLARDSYAEAIGIGSDVRTWTAYGMFLARVKEFPAAKAAIDRALSIDPTFKPALAAKSAIAEQL